LHKNRLNSIPFFIFANAKQGGLAQLARALAWHARGHRFDSDILHPKIRSGKKLDHYVVQEKHLYQNEGAFFFNISRLTAFYLAR
jgi:hypothetical protein